MKVLRKFTQRKTKFRQLHFTSVTKKIHHLITTKAEEVESMTNNLELLKRIVEESDLDQIEKISDSAPQILGRLQNNYDVLSQEVFLLAKKEQDLQRQAEALDQDIHHLKASKRELKEDLEKANLDPVRTGIVSRIRKANYEGNDQSFRFENLPVDSKEFDQWNSKLSKVETDLLKYFRIYMDLAQVTSFDLACQEKRDHCEGKKSTTSEESKPTEINEIMLLEKTPEEISKTIKQLENWINLFPLIRKRNTLKKSYHMGVKFPKERKSQRRGSRRSSVLQSFFNPVLQRKVSACSIRIL